MESTKLIVPEIPLAEVIDKHRLWLAGDAAGIRANLSRANLSGADLGRANLSGANLSEAYLSDIKNMPSFQIVPETGSFTGWKKLAGGIIAELRIPTKAARCNSTGRKCRAEYVEVVNLFSETGELLQLHTFAVSNHDQETRYHIGQEVRPDKWNPDIREECTNGIHFFITRAEAKNY